ncbi:thioredoxin reductase-like selenoprotein T1a isoform X1 [Takifugu flavidus]|uniref:thioredoxin reductase-like selenoprotein T1a isoform X1 n=1 Tax=Takifugu flavidus TaxID=433684 RepID=UPI00254409D9|nr:thioredoxin reductase-like selenoprotein T1a isoform X1 [Takifugu flavidus]
MATKGKRKRSSLCLAVILFFVSHFARTAESFRLSKTEKSAAAADFKPGRIVFGNIFDKTSGVDAPVEDGAHISPSSTEGDVNYQGDYPGLQTNIPDNMKFMNPSVLCGLNKMKFMAQGADAQQFSMDPGASGLPVPLPNVPSTCGYDTQWNSPSLSMVVPYNGCFMIITGGYYVLPMLWYNIQFSLWCPMSSWGQPPPMQAAATTPPPVSQPQYHPFWNLPFQMPQQVKHPPWILPSGQMPQAMPFPNLPFWNPYFYPTTMPKTTTIPPSQTSTLPSPGGQVPFNPIQFPYPWGLPMFPPGGAFPVKTKPNQPMPPFGPGYPFPYQYNVPPVFNPFPIPPAKPNHPPFKFPFNFPMKLPYHS